MSEVDQILYQYNRLIAQYNDFSKQVEQKEKRWKEMEDRFSVVEMYARELCEAILAKDKTETGLGANYSWGSVDVVELLKKAKISFQNYNTSRSNLLKSLYAQSEDRRKELESLKAKSVEDVYNHNPKINETIKKVNEVVNSPEGKSYTQGVIDFFDSDDIEDAPVKSGKNNIKTGTTSSKFMLSDHHQKEKQKKHNNKQDISNTQNNKSQERFTLNYAEAENISNKMTQHEKNIIQTMGDTGVMTIDGIIAKSIKATGRTTLTTSIKSLKNKDIVESYAVSCGIQTRTFVYRLTALGESMYQYLYKKKPVMSEWQKVISEHSSIDHGCNIIEMANIMRNYPDAYSYVNEWNRNHPIDVVIPKYNVNTKKIEKTKGEYVPDIVFRYANDQRNYYIEFERNTCSTEQFNEKCEKLFSITKRFLFVVSNKDDANQIISRINIWLNSKEYDFFKHNRITISVASIRKFRTYDMADYRQWDYFYDTKVKEWKYTTEYHNT